MIGHDLRALVGSHRGQPALLAVGDPLLEVLLMLREVGGVARADGGELALDLLGDALPVLGVEPVVRVSGWVHVAHGPGDLAGGDLQDTGGERRVEVAIAARLDARVAALGDERRQPPDLQLPAHGNEQVGLVQLQDEARLGLHEMRIEFQRVPELDDGFLVLGFLHVSQAALQVLLLALLGILVAARQRLRLDLVTSDLPGDRGQVLGGRHDVQWPGGARGAWEASGEQREDGGTGSHDRVS